MATLGPYYLGPDTAHPAYGIYYGDCVRGMAKIPDGTVDIVLTSPPYNVGLNYTGFDDNASDGEFKAFNRRWLTEAYRVMRDTGRAYVVVGDKMLWWFKDLAEQIGWTYVQLLTWCKPNMAGGAAISGDWDHLTEQILLFRKGKRTPMLNGEGVNTHNWFVETAPQSNFNGHQRKRHPAQWPLGLCLKLLARTPGSVVLDPFAGSGQGLLAAKLLGRQYLGFELSLSVAIEARDYLRNTQPPLPMAIPEQLSLEAIA